MLKKVCILLSLIFAPLLSVNPAFAESGDVVMSVNPSEQNLELKPGKRYEKEITVYNLGRLGFDFEVDVTPYQAEGDDYKPNFTTTNNYTKLSNWITFPESKFHIEPGTAQVVKFEVTVPEDITGGGQYAAIIVRMLNSGDEGPAVQLVGQIASLVYGHVSGAETVEQGQMIAHDIPTFLLNNNFRMSSTFENSGNVDYEVTETMTIRDFFTNREIITPETVGDSNYPIGTSSSTVLPGTKRTIEMVWKDAPQLGVFRVKQTIEYLAEELSFEKIVIICPLWLIILLGAFILLLIIWIIARIHNRQYEQPQVF